MAYDEKSGDGWCQHLHYDALMADPLATVRGLYRSFGDEVSDLHARRMEAFLEQRPQDAFGRHRYDPADFGWTYAGLAEEFADYTARYQVRTEAHPAGRHVRRLSTGRRATAIWGHPPSGRTIAGMSERSRTSPAARACPPPGRTSASWPRPRRCRPT